MKKLGFLFFVALVMVSCGNTYKAKKIVLADFQDSINYVVGFHNGLAIHSQIFKTDSGAEVINAFIDALSEGYDASDKQSQAASIGSSIGSSLKKNEETGLAENPHWVLNEDLFFKGFINGILQDTSIINFNQAQTYFQTVAQQEQQGEAPTQKVSKKATCPTKKTFQPVTINSQLDSINYIFGYLNGYQICIYALNNDSTSKSFDDLVKNINESLRSSSKYADQRILGKQIGSTIKSQEKEGLLGISGWETKFELIKQGFINGLYSFDELINQEEAQNFISESIDKFQYADVKEQNRVWLEENAKKEGVMQTPSGLQYKVIKMGNGKKPAETDKVRVHYHGTLIDGTVFDSSVDRGEPAEFALNAVIRGWTEGLQLMPVGSKFTFYIKPELGYGNNDMGTIKPHSILVFDVELLDIVKE